METLFQKKERCSKELLSIIETALKNNDLKTIMINDHTLGVYTLEGNFKISIVMKKEGHDFSYEIEGALLTAKMRKEKEKSLKEYAERRKRNGLV